MGIFKFHKDSFRWITNAHICIFSPLINVNSKLLKALASGFTKVIASFHQKLFLFCHVNANAYWLINNNYDFMINLSEKIHSIYTFDIMACYEAIPHFVTYGLIDVLNRIIVSIKKLGYVGFQSYYREFKLTKSNKRIMYTLDQFISINVFLLNNFF